MVKRKQRQPLIKVQKNPGFDKTESDDSDKNGEEEEPVVKRILKLTKKAPKSPGLTDTDLEDSDIKNEQEPAVRRKQRQSKKN